MERFETEAGNVNELVSNQVDENINDKVNNAKSQGIKLIQETLNPVNLLDKMGLGEFMKFQNDSFVNILRQNIPTLSIIGLSIVMYILGLFSSCMDCSPFRTMILIIYVFILSSILTYQSVEKVCPPKDKLTPEIFLGLLQPGGGLVPEIPDIGSITNDLTSNLLSGVTSGISTPNIPGVPGTSEGFTTSPPPAPEQRYNKDELSKLMRLYDNKNKTARLSTAIGYALGVAFVFTLIYILLPLLALLPLQHVPIAGPIFLVFKILTTGPGKVIFPGIIGAIVFYFMQNYAQYQAAKRDCNRDPELQGKSFLIF